MGEHDRRGHQLGRLVARVAEHDPLVARTLFGRLFPFSSLGVHTLRDVRALDGEVVVDKKSVGVEDVVSVGVADATDRVPHDFSDVDHIVDRLGGTFLPVLKRWDGDFATDDYDIAFDKGLTGHAALRVDREAGIQNRV